MNGRTLDEVRYAGEALMRSCGFSDKPNKRHSEGTF